MRTLYAGAGLALTAGLLMGAAMRPNLDVGDRPAGPQIFAGTSGARAAGPFDDGLAYANYAGNIPDYVLGTDWRKLAEAPMAEAPVFEPAAYEESYYDSPLAEAPPEPALHAPDPVDWRAPAAEHVAYPSLEGGAAYEDVSRAEKTLVAARPAEIDRDAPPEATGDTTLAR